MRQESLFPGAEPPALPPLDDPVEHFACVKSESAAAVLLRFPGWGEAWVPKSLVRFDGAGWQRLQIERWKAREMEL